MKLVHYSDAPLGPLRVIEQTRGTKDDTFKPRGLWVSDDGCEDNWRTWCESQEFSLHRLKFAHDVKLKPNANVLVLREAAEIDAFTDEWAVPPPIPLPGFHSRMWINWTGLRERYQGMIVTPYIWERRLSYGAMDAMWYYSWDCASGCIWDPAAIASVRLRED